MPNRHALGGLLALGALAAVGWTVSMGPLAPTPVPTGTGQIATVAGQVTSAPGQALFQASCAACHGPQGQGTPDGPDITNAGAALTDFMLRTGRMPLSSPTDPVQRGRPIYSDAEITALVDYVASFGHGPAIPNIQVSSASDIAAGRAAYIATCAACHGAGASGDAVGGGAVAPPLLNTPPTQVAEAVRTGPGRDAARLTRTRSRTSSWRGSRHTSRSCAIRRRPAGSRSEETGPVAEGYVAWIVYASASPRRPLGRTAGAPDESLPDRMAHRRAVRAHRPDRRRAPRRLHPRRPDPGRRRAACRRARRARDRHRPLGTGPDGHARCRSKSAIPRRRARRRRRSSRRPSTEEAGFTRRRLLVGMLLAAFGGSRRGARDPGPVARAGARGGAVLDGVEQRQACSSSVDGKPVRAGDLPVDSVADGLPGGRRRLRRQPDAAHPRATRAPARSTAAARRLGAGRLRRVLEGLHARGLPGRAVSGDASASSSARATSRRSTSSTARSRRSGRPAGRCPSCRSRIAAATARSSRSATSPSRSGPSFWNIDRSR